MPKESKQSKEINELKKKYEILVGVKRKKKKNDIDLENEDKKIEIENEILSIYNYFYSNLNKVDDFFKLNNRLLKNEEKNKEKIRNTYIKKYSVKEQDDEFILGLTKEQFKEYYLNNKDNQIIGLGEIILPKSMLIYFHSLFETFLSKILCLIYENSQDQFDDNNTKFTFSELKSFNSINDAKKFIINQRISSVLYSSIDKQLETLYFLLGIGKSYIEYDFLMKDLIEISIRRNLFTHEDGIVNDIYINKCLEYGIDNKFEKGQKIIFEDRYFENVYKVYYEFSIKIIFFTWVKLSKEENKYDIVAGNFVNNRIFNMIRDNDLDLGLRISNFILSPKFINKVEEATKLMLSLNNALIYKKKGNKDKVFEILKGIDWSAKSDIYIFAKNILLEEWDEAGKIMKKVVKKINNQDDNNSISEIELQTWPLFFEFKEQEIFKKSYKKIFGEEFISSIF